ncbi:MAG: apolipoprotein N-acyltransferase [Pseudomonadota bacterium]
MSQDNAPKEPPGQQARSKETSIWAALAARLTTRPWQSAFVAGLLCSLAMPPIGLFPVLWVSFPILLFLVAQAPTRGAAFRLGWWFGFGFFVLGLYWIAFALTVDLARLFWLIPFAMAGLPAVLGIFVGVVTAVWHRLGPPTGLLGPISFALIWAAGEWLRGNLFTGFPWNLMAYSWDRVLAVEQIAFHTGAYGLSLLTVLCASMPAAVILSGDDSWPKRRAILTSLGCIGLLAATSVWGAARLAANPPGPAANHPNIVLRLVQPGIDQHEKWNPDNWPEHFNLHLRLSQEEATGVTHVIWPETAATFFLDRDAPVRNAIAQATPLGGASIIGAPRVEATPEGNRYFNSAQIISPSGAILDSYDKAHLVPFGEYVPFSDWIPFVKVVAGAADYSPGPGLRTLRAPGLPPFSPLICYEAIFPGKVVASDPDSASPRPQWLLNLTNDAWYGKTTGPHQHFAIARMRAIEEGLPLVRVATNGISGLVDPYGRVLEKLPLGPSGYIDVPLPKPAIATISSK